MDLGPPTCFPATAEVGDRSGVTEEVGSGMDDGGREHVARGRRHAQSSGERWRSGRPSLGHTGRPGTRIPGGSVSLAERPLRCPCLGLSVTRRQN